MKHWRKLRYVLILGCLLFFPVASRAEDQTTCINIGIVNNTNVSAHGFEFGAVNQVDHDFNGFQLGLIANVTKRSLEGFQAAVFYNDAEEEIHGLQLGIVNHTGSLNGIQIGILNFNDDTKYLGFFPFINAAF
jgi:hypothetical protein